MANYLIIDNDTIVNVIVADTIEIATEVTGKEAIESFGPTPWIDWKRVDGAWIEPTVEETND